MKNKLIIPLVISCVGLIVSIIAILLSGVLANKNTFPKNTKLIINEKDIYISGMTPKEAYDTYIKEIKNTIAVTVGNNVLDFDVSKEIQSEIKEADINKLLQECSYKDYLAGSKTFTLKDRLTYNADSLTKKVRKLLKDSGYKYKKSKNAYFDKSKLIVISEEIGTEIDPAKAADGIIGAIKNGKDINLNSEEFYVQPSVKEKQIKERYEDVISISKWKAEYSVSNYVIKLADYPKSITVNNDGTYDINTDFLKNAVLELSKTVDKVGAKRKFKSTKDGTIWVSGGTYGQLMDNEKEIDCLKEMIKKGESVKAREPIWKIRPPKPDSEDTYVEVDISEQHIWYYKKGKLVMQSDIVTGLANGERNTPTGWYFVSEKVNGKYLIGADYKTWVNKWMRLTNTGIGLHDATWRGKFGGSIYKYNGSHGCINLPYSFAAKLYDKLDIGTMVVIHK